MRGGQSEPITAGTPPPWHCQTCWQSRCSRGDLHPPGMQHARQRSSQVGLNDEK